MTLREIEIEINLAWEGLKMDACMGLNALDGLGARKLVFGELEQSLLYPHPACTKQVITALPGTTQAHLSTTAPPPHPHNRHHKSYSYDYVPFPQLVSSPLYLPSQPKHPKTFFVDQLLQNDPS
jgi:hypothetical protein